MKAGLVLSLSLLVAVGACSGSGGGEWTKAGASQQERDSAIYWCTRTIRTARYEHPAERMNNMPGANERARFVDEECMRDRGFQRSAR